MQINAWLVTAQQTLISADIATARLDCFVLLEDETGKDRAWLLSHPEHELQIKQLENMNTKIVQRSQHVPLAYIRGKVEFYGRDFIVNNHTLVPRPETEAMIELLKRVRNLEADIATWQVERRGRTPIKKKYLFEKQEPTSSLVRTDAGYKVVWQKPPRAPLTQPTAPIHGQSLKYHDEDLLLIDIGTGSGAVAITAKLEIPDTTVIATDIDAKCLETTRINANRLGADIIYTHGNLMEPLDLPTDKTVILLCNLPYVPDDFHVNTAATHEPKHALFGGPDGLDVYRQLFGQIRAGATKPAYVLTESLPSQHNSLAAIAETAGYRVRQTDDFVQLFEPQA